MKARKHIPLIVGLALALMLPAVAQTNSSGGGQYDQQVQNDINKYVQKHKEFKNVTATVQDGVVNLQGNVDLLVHKLDIDKKAHGIDHVQAVRNGIEVQGDVPDDKLQEKLADKLRYDRIGYGIMFNSLSLAVHNGIVTVSGNVHDYPSRDSALAVVESTPGVKGVVDDITVAPTSSFDDELRVRLARAIYGDPVMTKYRIDPQAPIRIVVENGHVTLAGVVNSQLDKQIAETRAKTVPGVFSVDDQLMVAGSEKKK